NILPSRDVLHRSSLPQQVQLLGGHMARHAVVAPRIPYLADRARLEARAAGRGAILRTVELMSSTGTAVHIPAAFVVTRRFATVEPKSATPPARERVALIVYLGRGQAAAHGKRPAGALHEPEFAQHAHGHLQHKGERAWQFIQRDIGLHKTSHDVEDFGPGVVA